MAAAQDPVDLEQKLQNSILECPVCMMTFNTPKILPCFHVFCKNCLAELIAKGSKGPNFHCPTCRQKYKVPAGGVDKIQTSLMHINLADELEKHCSLAGRKNRPRLRDLNPDSPMCFWCDDKHLATEYLCAECGLLCQVCKNAHDRIQTTKQHVVKEITVYKNKDVQCVTMCKREYCKEHPGRELEFYCDVLECAICSMCMISSHRDHASASHKPCYEKKQECVTAISKIMPMLTRMSYVHSKYLDEYKLQYESEQEQIAQIIEDVRAKRDRVISEVQKESEDMLETLGRFPDIRNVIARQTELRDGISELKKQAMDIITQPALPPPQDKCCSPLEVAELSRILRDINDTLDNKVYPQFVGARLMPYVEFITENEPPFIGRVIEKLNVTFYMDIYTSGNPVKTEVSPDCRIEEIHHILDKKTWNERVFFKSDVILDIKKTVEENDIRNGDVIRIDCRIPQPQLPSIGRSLLTRLSQLYPRMFGYAKK